MFYTYIYIYKLSKQGFLKIAMLNREFALLHILFPWYRCEASPLKGNSDFGSFHLRLRAILN